MKKGDKVLHKRVWLEASEKLTRNLSESDQFYRPLNSEANVT